jgi:hypothetical protein
MIEFAKSLICFERNELFKLKKDSSLSSHNCFLYVYYLNDVYLSYPEGKSKIVYIGITNRQPKSKTKRFEQHISSSKHNGSDTGSNLVLSNYYHSEIALSLNIYSINVDYINEAEGNLIKMHILLYGAPPLAQGQIPKLSKQSKAISTLYQELVFIAENHPKLKDCLLAINSGNCE